jgi:predicted acyltransferase
MGATPQIPSAPASERLISLDVFRGFTILLMIVVNASGESSFAQLQHSEWNGWTLTDLVFPFFLFITGVSLTFSLASRINASRINASRINASRINASRLSASPSQRNRLRLLPHVFRRSAIIFAIGLLINGFPYYHLATWRIPGVLQRIALCYLVASLLYLWLGVRARWAVVAALLLGYWILMRFAPVPGFGIPTVNIPLLDPDRNLVAWLDRRLMWGHLYQPMRDPEGLLSTLPAIAGTLFGVAAGEWIRTLRANSAKLLRRLVASGLACFLAAELWSLIFPINKKLWTSSYVLLTVGLAMLSLAACYWLMDVKKLRGRGTIIPIVFGTNCIFAYAFSEFAAASAAVFKFPFGGNLVSAEGLFKSFTVANIAQPQYSALAFALFYAAFCWFFTWLLYRRKIFLKI